MIEQQTDLTGQWLAHPPEPYGEAGWQVLENLGEGKGFQTVIGEKNCERDRVFLSKRLAENIAACVNFCAGIDLERLKIDCGDPTLTLADIIRDGDALADEAWRDEATSKRLRSALQKVLVHLNGSSDVIVKVVGDALKESEGK